MIIATFNEGESGSTPEYDGKLTMHTRCQLADNLLLPGLYALG